MFKPNDNVLNDCAAKIAKLTVIRTLEIGEKWYYKETCLKESGLKIHEKTLEHLIYSFLYNPLYNLQS